MQQITRICRRNGLTTMMALTFATRPIINICHAEESPHL